MIRDKSILIKNIYYMLSYAFTSLKEEDGGKIAAEKFENIHNLFAAILASGTARLLKRGLYREYGTRTGDLAVARGRIDMAGTLKNRAERKRLLSCEYDELTENNLPNRILKTAAMLLLRHGGVDEKHKSELKKAMLFFSAVDEIDPARIRWADVRLGRNGRGYRMPLGVCRLIFEGMLPSDGAGDRYLSSFTDEGSMSRLYEKFILEYYIREHPELHAAASQIPWALTGGGDALLPVMQTDVTLSKGGKVLIIDAKYYTHSTRSRYGAHTQHSGNLYQIFTYVKNKEAELGSVPHTVSGMLLYAATNEDVQPDGEYTMSGNRIIVRTLDLNRDFSEISAALDGIVNGYFRE